MRTKIVIVGFLAAVLGIALPSLASAQGMGAQGGEQQNTNKMPEGPPDATFDFEGEQFRLILGGGSGKGVLHYQGKDYPFTGKGASAGGIGVTKADALGKVYHLDKALRLRRLLLGRDHWRRCRQGWRRLVLAEQGGRGSNCAGQANGRGPYAGHHRLGYQVHQAAWDVRAGASGSTWMQRQISAAGLVRMGAGGLGFGTGSPRPFSFPIAPTQRRVSSHPSC